MKRQHIIKTLNKNKKLIIWIIIALLVGLVFIALSLYLVFIYPVNQVSQLGVNNVTEEANLINQTRTTLIPLIAMFAQIFGGIVILIGVYFAWENLKVAQENIRISQEGQITERFTRAIDQLGAFDHIGNPAIEIRLGGIYALERISKESYRDYWPIIEILTAYIRKNSNIKNYENNKDSISVEIQTILTILKKRKFFYENGEFESLDLRRTFLKRANLRGANLQRVFLQESNLIDAKFIEANLEGACLFNTNCMETNFTKANLREAFFTGAILQNARFEDTNCIGAYLSKVNLSNADLVDSIFACAIFQDANLEEAYFRWANLENAIFCRVNLQGAIFEGANLSEAIFQEADFLGANLIGANFLGADLIGAKNLTQNQLSSVKTLYKARLNDDLLIPLKKNYPTFFDEPKE